MIGFVIAIVLWGQLPPPTAASKEKGAIVVGTKEVKQRWANEWTMEKVSAGGVPSVHFTEKGEGVIAPFREKVRWSIDATWSAGAVFRPLHVEKIVSDLQGKVIQRELKRFDAEKGQVEFLREEPGSSRSVKKTLTVPPDTLAVEGLVAALRSLPFAGARSVRAHLLSNEPRLYEVSFAVRGRERITTPLGPFDTYRVELVPDVGVLNMFRVFFPKANFWFTVESPHFWVRYEGPENGVGTPGVVMELRSYER